MYTIKIDKTNHTATIINTITKRGITMRNIGDEMAAFLAVMAKKAGVADEIGKMTDSTYGSYQGDTYCFFCNEYGDVSEDVNHKDDCLWVVAKKLSKIEIEQKEISNVD